MRPISASAPMAPRSSSRRPACHGAGAGAGAVRSPAWRGVVYRLVLRAPVGRLSRHADAGLRPDLVVDRLPVGRGHLRAATAWSASGPPPGSPTRRVYYYLTVVLCGLGIAVLWRALFSPFGYVLRAGRDSPLRAEAIGIDLRALSMGRLRARGNVRGPGRRRLRFLQGQHLALVDLHRPIHRRTGDGAAGRRRTRWSGRSSVPPSSLAARHASRARPSSGAPCSGW